MNTQTKNWRPAKNLLPTDLSPTSERTFPYAAALARHYDATIYLTHVLPATEDAAAEKECRDAAERKMSANFSGGGQLNGVRHEILLEKGYLWQTLDALIRKYEIDMAIVGTHGCKDKDEDFAGSWAELIFRNADCPVMTVGPKVSGGALSAGGFKNILLATDFGRASERSVPYACCLAREYGAALTLLHVLDGGSKYSQDGLAILQETSRVQLVESLPAGTEQNCKLAFIVRAGDSAQEIVDAARSTNADLIVMGAKSGRTLLTHLPEPATYTVAAGAPCPVMTVRG